MRAKPRISKALVFRRRGSGKGLGAGGAGTGLCMRSGPGAGSLKKGRPIEMMVKKYIVAKGMAG